MTKRGRRFVRFRADAESVSRQIDERIAFGVRPPEPLRIVEAFEIPGAVGTSLRPVRVRASDGAFYAVKGAWRSSALYGDDPTTIARRRHNPRRSLIADRVVSLLGAQIVAPVVRPSLAQLTERERSVFPCLNHFDEGQLHATPWLDGVVEHRQFSKINLTRQHRQMARLALLYSWLKCGDRQVLVHATTGAVTSVDHGQFFGNANWTAQSLNTLAADDVWPDSPIMEDAGLKFDQCEVAALELASMECETIVDALLSVPSEWEMSDADRVALASFILRRRDSLLLQLNYEPVLVS